ncbi:MAG: putative cobaltochelatase [Desulfobacteraceae bacterium]|nr:putative cobaltochelatase [Desulfobacteraceae bacterium]MBC2720066.1 putative cobaltochelatase [Desulfobacteraceae bacterium]
MKNQFKNIYPFSAIIGQDQMKLALILNAIDPGIGGVLIRGEKGTAKSTAVRSLAALLPDLMVVAGCPYSCRPEHPAGLCETCRDNGTEPLTSAVRKVKVVDLPLNATEDMVLGGIDFGFAVKSGFRRFHPGLLAEANRGFLYIDEVNLLDDHIVDVILDASGSGENIVEREGISFRHPARFIPVGTMNPEEGDLRPQFLDRFGLCVQVTGETDPEGRIELMKRREAFDNNPETFLKRFERQEKNLADQIVRSQELLTGIKLTEKTRTFITELCLENNVAGHRADIVIERTASALAAYEERTEVNVDDVNRAASMALPHRRRDAMPPPPPPPPEKPEDDSQEKDENKEEQPDQDRPDEKEDQAPDQKDQSAKEIEEPYSGELKEEEPEQKGDAKSSREQIFEIGETFKVRKIAPAKDRVLRRGSGRRSRTRTAQKQGRYVKSALSKGRGDIALDATLRAAAPYQLRRRLDAEAHDNLTLFIKEEDIREKVREKRVGNFILFLVDASGSMGARARMVASKGAVLSLLLDAYQKRDRVAMVTFRRGEASVNLPPTTSIELAAKLLGELPVGGRTPLSAGLIKGFDLIRIHLLKDPSARPIFIIITDGKTNEAIGEGKPVDEAFSFAQKMSLEDRIKYVVVDTEQLGIIRFGLAEKLASVLCADYFKIEDLKADELIDITRRNI